MRSSPVPVLRSDGSVIYVNQAVLDYNDLTLEDVQKEDYRARFFHPEDVERLREERQRATRRAQPVTSRSPWLPNAGGVLCCRHYRTDARRGTATVAGAMRPRRS